MARPQRYSTDLSDKQWQKLEAVWPQAKNGRTGRPRKYPLREVVNTIFYQLRTGCAWRLLPHDLVPWNVAWEHFWRWREDGTLQVIQDALHEQVRAKEGRDTAPSAAALDSQAVKTTEKGGPEVMSAAKP
jgi:putative transposase